MRAVICVVLLVRLSAKYCSVLSAAYLEKVIFASVPLVRFSAASCDMHMDYRRFSPQRTA